MKARAANSSRVGRNGSNWQFSAGRVGPDVGPGQVVGRVRVMYRVCCDLECTMVGARFAGLLGLQPV